MTAIEVHETNMTISFEEEDQRHTGYWIDIKPNGYCSNETLTQKYFICGNLTARTNYSITMETLANNIKSVPEVALQSTGM